MSLHTSKNLLHTISYPPAPKKPFYSPPLKNAQSKELVATYKKSVESKRNDLRKFILTTSGERTSGPTATQLVEEGKTFLDKHDVDGALSNLLEAVRMGLDTPEVYRLAGEAYKDKGMASEAIEMYTKSLERDPLNMELYHDKGNCFLQLDDFNSAVDEFEKYLKMEQPVYDLLVKTGKACLDAERFDRALELLNSAMEINDKDPYVLYNMGELHERIGDTAKATEYFGKVHAADNDFAKPYLERAAIEEKEENLALALHLYESILKVLPTDAKIYVHCADIYLRLGEEYSSNALSCLTKSIELATGDEDDELLGPLLYVKRGVLLFDQFNDLDAAIADFTIALAEDDNLDTALEFRAACFRQRNQMGDLQAAKDDYEKFVNHDKVAAERKGPPCVFLAEYYFSNRQYTQAANFYQQAWLCNVDYPFELEKISLAYLHSWVAKTKRPEEEAVPTITTNQNTTTTTTTATLQPPKDPNRPTTADTHTTAVSADEASKCASLQQYAFDAYYRPRRELEPTAHTELFYAFHDAWQPHTEDMARRTNPEAGGKGAKKAAKKK
eukprot:TRINITY_DN105334_c0_g1_i1.p1 TRINITY_DN105334_c0_g1~~TRINITY_DN105334_c0_g1_i1.p1  ORF type:complete len:558 (+),score=85.03 TRINITY_DN105334_c0_g1_i1:61-1734(+)